MNNAGRLALKANHRFIRHNRPRPKRVGPSVCRDETCYAQFALIQKVCGAASSEMPYCHNMYSKYPSFESRCNNSINYMKLVVNDKRIGWLAAFTDFFAISCPSLAQNTRPASGGSGCSAKASLYRHFSRRSLSVLNANVPFCSYGSSQQH
ncbi:hypothetical protein IF2G_10878 [Cordyceps javanica]|nr:hypothetical protein IF2G_10878 [Cordyceps javanica]